MALAKSFYEATFATTLDPLSSPEPSIEMWRFSTDGECVNQCGAPGALCKMDGCSAGAGGTLIYFSCDDCALEEARAAKAGGTILKPKFPIGEYGFISNLTDTEGNTIGLHSIKWQSQNNGTNPPGRTLRNLDLGTKIRQDQRMDLSRRSFLKSVAAAAGSLPFISTPVKSAEDGSVPQRKFGRHDEMLSVIGLGGHTLKLSGSPGIARQICDQAIARGVNFFDNSWDYHGGAAEEVMGEALKGNRDKVFLMSKFCIYHNNTYTHDKLGAMKMLEDSLRRLKTDHLDLWMLHNVAKNDGATAYQPNGAVEAFELAKKQGKIRYTGFTGHSDPKIHAELIRGGFEWDATLMPVSALGALSSRRFEQDVMPLCIEKNIAVLGMKGFGGSKRAYLHGKTNIEEILRYSLSYSQVCTHVIGIDELDYVDQAVLAAAKTPMSKSERDEHVARLSREGGSQYAMYLDPEYDECYSRGSYHHSQIA